MVTHPANMVMTIIPRAIASLASFERIEEYLLEASQRRYREVVHGAQGSQTSAAIALRNVNICFSSTDRPVIQNASLEIPRGFFFACLGAVGSGKTSLARAIAGDLQCSSGSISTSSHLVGLCTQTPWLPAGTLHDAICGASSKSETGCYNQVINACCLDCDIQALARGDQTQIGSRGLNLSGGQRQRVVCLKICIRFHDNLLIFQ